MSLGKQFFELLEGKFEGIDLFLEVLEELQRVPALPEVDDLLVKELFLLLLLLLFLLSEELLVMGCLAVGLV